MFGITYEFTQELQMSTQVATGVSGNSGSVSVDFSVGPVEPFLVEQDQVWNRQVLIDPKKKGVSAYSVPQWLAKITYFDIVVFGEVMQIT